MVSTIHFSHYYECLVQLTLLGIGPSSLLYKLNTVFTTLRPRSIPWVEREYSKKSDSIESMPLRGRNSLNFDFLLLVHLAIIPVPVVYTCPLIASLNSLSSLSKICVIWHHYSAISQYMLQSEIGYPLTSKQKDHMQLQKACHNLLTGCCSISDGENENNTEGRKEEGSKAGGTPRECISLTRGDKGRWEVQLKGLDGAGRSLGSWPTWPLVQTEAEVGP